MIQLLTFFKLLKKLFSKKEDCKEISFKIEGKVPFHLSENIITGAKTISVEIANQIFWWHLFPMVPVREDMQCWVKASFKVWLATYLVGKAK